MDEIISYKMCAVKVRNAKLRNYLNTVTASYTKLYNFQPYSTEPKLYFPMESCVIKTHCY
jgi:hypothetical protein